LLLIVLYENGVRLAGFGMDISVVAEPLVLLVSLDIDDTLTVLAHIVRGGFLDGLCGASSVPPAIAFDNPTTVVVSGESDADHSARTASGQVFEFWIAIVVSFDESSWNREVRDGVF
jgi:hypothetical protein